MNIVLINPADSRVCRLSLDAKSVWRTRAGKFDATLVASGPLPDGRTISARAALKGLSETGLGYLNKESTPLSFIPSHAGFVVRESDAPSVRAILLDRENSALGKEAYKSLFGSVKPVKVTLTVSTPKADKPARPAGVPKPPADGEYAESDKSVIEVIARMSK